MKLKSEVTSLPNRRDCLYYFIGGFAVSAAGLFRPAFGQSIQSLGSDVQRRREEALKRDAEAVERLYSVKPARFHMGKRMWMIPINFQTPKGRDEADEQQVTYLTFNLFLPDYNGYTRENWRDQFDRRRIEVQKVSLGEKEVREPASDGNSRQNAPEFYGDPNAGFRNLRPLMEESPSFNMYGLKGYKRRGTGSSGVFWSGNRTNGEFFFFQSSLAPGEPLQPGLTNPLCHTQYYSAQEDLFIAYRYSQTHIAAWREIDSAIWEKLRAWQTK